MLDLEQSLEKMAGQWPWLALALGGLLLSIGALLAFTGRLVLQLTAILGGFWLGMIGAVVVGTLLGAGPWAFPIGLVAGISLALMAWLLNRLWVALGLGLVMAFVGPWMMLAGNFGLPAPAAAAQARESLLAVWQAEASQAESNAEADAERDPEAPSAAEAVREGAERQVAGLRAWWLEVDVRVRQRLLLAGIGFGAVFALVGLLFPTAGAIGISVLVGVGLMAIGLGLLASQWAPASLRQAAGAPLVVSGTAAAAVALGAVVQGWVFRGRRL